MQQSQGNAKLDFKIKLSSMQLQIYIKENSLNFFFADTVYLK